MTSAGSRPRGCGRYRPGCRAWSARRRTGPRERPAAAAPPRRRVGADDEVPGPTERDRKVVGSNPTSGSLLAMAEELGEAALAPERPGLDGSEWNVQVRGDLRLGEATEVRQHQDLTLLVWEAGERVTNLMSASVALGQLAAVLTGNILQVIQRACDVAPTTQMIDRSLTRDAEHPCGQASGGVVATVMSPEIGR